MHKHQYLTGNMLATLALLAFLTSLTGLVLPFSILIIFDRVMPNQAMTTLWFIYSIILFSIVADTKLKAYEERVTNRITKQFEQEMTTKVFHALCHANLQKFQQFGAGEYMDRIRTITTLRSYFGGDTMKAVINGVTCCIIFAIIALINWRAAAVLVVASVVLCVLSRYISGKKVARLEEKATLEGNTTSKIIEIVSHPLNVKTSSMEYRMENFMDEVVQRREDSAIALEKIEARFPLIMECIQQIAIAAVVSVCALSVIGLSMSQGGMAAIILLTNRYFAPYRQIMGMLGQWRVNVMQLRRLEDILTLEEHAATAHERFVLHKLVMDGGKRFQCRPGHIYVMSGPSCSGKTSMMKTIARTHHHPQMQVHVNGAPLEQIDYSLWTQHVVRVDAHSSFIEGTLIDNITCFRPKLHKAAYALSDAMGIKAIIDRLPRGFYTELKGTRNYPFSRQVHFALLIIRALLCKKQVLIIDDLDLVYDAAFAQGVLRCLESRIEGMICFVVSNHITHSNARIVHVPIAKVLGYEEVAQ